MQSLYGCGYLPPSQGIQAACGAHGFAVTPQMSRQSVRAQRWLWRHLSCLLHLQTLGLLSGRAWLSDPSAWPGRGDRGCASGRGALPGSWCCTGKCSCARLEDLLLSTRHKSKDEDEWPRFIFCIAVGVMIFVERRGTKPGALSKKKGCADSWTEARCILYCIRPKPGAQVLNCERC